MVKKILFILLVGLISYQSFSQGLVEEQGRKRSFAWIRSQDVTVSRYFIFKGDTIPFENIIDSLYLMVGDSALYITPHHLDSIIATLAGGHNPVTIDSLGTVAGMYINNDQLLGMMQSGPTQNGWLSWDDWIAFNAKLSWVYHDGTMTGEGTYTNPLGIDTTKFITTIDDEPFSADWDGDLNATSKNSIYDYLTSLSISGTDLSYAAGPAYITVYSSNGDDINLPLANQANAGLMGPTDKAKLDNLNYPVDTIYVTADAVFPIEYLYYNNDGTPIYVTDIPKPNGLFSGGLVTLQYGLSFAVSPAAYYINGELYTSPSTTLSLDSPDATYSRIDLFVVDTLGQALVITGVPAANPQTPSYDPTSQIPLTSVLILTNGSITNPGGSDVNTEVIYNENIEWVAGYSGVVTDYNSTTEVQTGSVSGDAGTMSSGDDLYFTNESDFSPSDYDVFSMWLYLKESIDSRDNLSLQFFNDGIAVSNLYPLTFDHSNTTSWQNISMNVSDITFTSETFDEVKITYVPRKSTTTFAGLYIDYVIFQKNIDPPTGDQTITLYGDVEGTGTTMILTEVIPDMVSSINGVTNDEDNIDLIEGPLTDITPDDGANTITIGIDTTALQQFVEDHSTTDEVDPVFNAHVASSITETDTANWNIDNDDTNELEMPQDAVAGQIAVKGDSGWLAVDPCDLLCVDSILALIKSFLDTTTMDIGGGGSTSVIDSTLCVTTNYLVFSDTLAFTPADDWTSHNTYGVSIDEDANYIYMVMTNTDGGSYLHPVIYSYNKSTQAISYEVLNTTNNYYGDEHKKPTILITSSGSLLLAIEQLDATGSSTHNSPLDLFKWSDPSDLTTYTKTQLTGINAAYPYLHETGGNIVLQFRDYDGTYDERAYYKSSDDGATWGTKTTWANIENSNLWAYSTIVSNTGDTAYVTIASRLVSQGVLYVSLFKTDFNTFWNLDGTSYGASLDGAEIEDAIVFGNTTEDTHINTTIGEALIGDYVYMIERYGTWTTTNSISAFVLHAINKNTGEHIVGDTIPTTFDFGSADFVNISGGLYLRAVANDSLYYYAINDNLSGWSEYCITPARASKLPTRFSGELTADFDPVTNVLRVFRFDDLDAAALTACTVGSPSSSPDVQVDSVMTDIYFVTNGITGIDTSIGLPTGVTASYLNDTITVSGNPSVVGTYNYVIYLTSSTCMAATAEGTINVSDSPVGLTGLLDSALLVYEFDETSGTIAYDELSNYDATNTGCTVNQVGKIGTSYLFDASTDKVTVSDADDFSFTDGAGNDEAFSLSMWIYSTDLSANYTFLFTKRAYTSAEEYALYLGTDDKLTFTLFGGGSGSIYIAQTGNTVFTEDTWYHVVVTYDGSETTSGIKLYVDGVAETLTPSSSGTYTGMSNTTTDAELGGRTPDGLHLIGYLDQTVIWKNREITSGDVSTLNNSGNGLPSNEF